jgi:hypothetical protein
VSFQPVEQGGIIAPVRAGIAPHLDQDLRQSHCGVHSRRSFVSSILQKLKKCTPKRDSVHQKTPPVRLTKREI